MNTLEESLASVEGVLDVSVIVPACFENPLKDCSVLFLTDVVSLKRQAVIPITAVMGAYHITTRYLKVPRVAVKKVLEGLLRTRSPALYPNISPELAGDALNYASTYNIESLDGYLVALARSLGARIVYSLDEALGNIREITVANPFPREKVQEYHEYIRAKTNC